MPCNSSLKAGQDVLGKRNGQKGGDKVWGRRNICSPEISYCSDPVPLGCAFHISMKEQGRRQFGVREASGHSADLREAMTSPQGPLQQRCQREEYCIETQPPPCPAIGRCFPGKLRFLSLGS